MGEALGKKSRRENILGTDPNKSNDYQTNPTELPTDDREKPLAQSEDKYMSVPEETTEE